MGNILKLIEQETEGKVFKSFKYCFDTVQMPHIVYEEQENTYIPLKDFAEDVHDPKSRDMRHEAEMRMTPPPIFQYFLDGSRKVYKIDDIQYDNKVFPIVSGQISVCCCKREMQDDGLHFKSFHNIEQEVYSTICLPVAANSEGVDDKIFFNNLALKIKALQNGGKIEKILYYPTKCVGNETLENKGIAKIQDEMVDCEKRIVARLTAKHLLTQDSYLIKDGTIQYRPMKSTDYKELVNIRNNYRRVVGVSKSFNPNLMKDKKGQSNAAAIANLPLFHRTPAYLWKPGEMFGDVHFAIWYVRIRDKRYSETPYSGILKLEKMLMTGKENEQGLSTEEIDMITANIINERNPVCYGSDARWANHLYPVYMTEAYCKSKFISDEYFINLF